MLIVSPDGKFIAPIESGYIFLDGQEDDGEVGTCSDVVFVSHSGDERVIHTFHSYRAAERCMRDISDAYANERPVCFVRSD